MQHITCSYMCMCACFSEFFWVKFHTFLWLFKKIYSPPIAQILWCKSFWVYSSLTVGPNHCSVCRIGRSQRTAHLQSESQTSTFEWLLLSCPRATAKGVVVTAICTWPESSLRSMASLTPQRMDEMNRKLSRFMSPVKINKILTCWIWKAF